MRSIRSFIGLSGGARKKKAPKRKSSSTASRKPKSRAQNSAVANPAKRTAPKRTLSRKNASRRSSIFNQRMLRYLTQQLAPYWTAIGIGATCALLVTLWISGVFYEMGQALERGIDRALIENGFTVENVEISGRTFTNKSKMKALMRLEKLVPFMKYDIEAVRKRIEDLEWVERAAVMRLWPNTIHVSLIEKRPIAIWQLDGMFSLIDRRGEVISSNHLSEFTSLPQLVGKGAAEAAPEFVDLLSRFPVLNSRLRAALRIGERRWTLRLDNGVQILLPDENVEEALTTLLTLDEKYRLLARQVQIIDMRDSEKIYLQLPSDDIVEMDGQESKT